jgi:hypothetical protein
MHRRLVGWVQLPSPGSIAQLTNYFLPHFFILRDCSILRDYFVLPDLLHPERDLLILSEAKDLAREVSISARQILRSLRSLRMRLVPGHGTQCRLRSPRDDMTL